MRIELLYYPECPSHERALELIQQALRDEGLQAEINIIRIETQEQADAYHFIGSPTIRINGRELQPQPNLPYRLTCRTFVHENGRLSPVPSLTMLREAIRQATSGGDDA